MKLVVFSHKLVWNNPESASGYATDGGFAFHMDAISQIFEQTIVAVPVSSNRVAAGEVNIKGHNLMIFPLENIKGHGLRRKMNYLLWLLKNITIFNRLINEADAVHTPIPSDIGTLGMIMARIKGKPLFVRHCGNWNVQKTMAERFWKWFMERYAGGINVMLATGLQEEQPSKKNENIKWIFSSSLAKAEIGFLASSVPSLSVKFPKLIIVCRMEEEKGVGRVILALDILRKDIPGLHLDIVGDGPALKSFQKSVTDLNLDDRVIFHGKLNHEGVLHIMQQAHFFCYPTTASEGFPKVVLEAMASGLPVLGTKVSAIKALIKNGGGILLENENPETLAAAIRQVLVHPEEYKAMQNAAMRTAGEFDLENWRDAIKTHLQRAWKIQN